MRHIQCHPYIFFVVTLLSVVLAYNFADKAIAMYFLQHKEQYEVLGDFISIVGESHWYIGSCILAFIFFKYVKKNELYEQRALFLLYANLFSGLISLIFKWIFGRVRPWGLRWNEQEYGFLLFDNTDLTLLEKMYIHFQTILDAPTSFTSFPSGHTTTLFAFFTFLTLLFPRFRLLFLVLTLLAASSRMLANDHFLSDIFAGICVGILATLFIYKKMEKRLEF